MFRTSNRTTLLTALGIALVLTIALPRGAAALTNPGDTMYLSDSAKPDDGVSYLFSVEIDAVTDHANLTPLANGTIYLNQIDALACTPDGSRIYGIDKYSPGSVYTGNGMMGYYDVAHETWHDVNYVMSGGDKLTGIVLAGFSPAGVLYVASQDTDLFYTVNLHTAEATPIGPVANSANGTTIHEQGADLAFTAAGSAYVWTNTPNGADAPAGLYKLNMQAITDHIPATYMGNSPGDFFTGVAIRANGFGDMAGSTHASEVHTQSLLNAQDTPGSPHPMYKDGSPYIYQYGDMSNGPLQLCTRTIGFYKNHGWLGRGVTICGKVITEDGASGTEDGQAFLNGDGYSKGPNGTDFSMFFAQLIAARLNTGNASGVPMIDTAEAWLCSQDVVLPSGNLDFHASFDNKSQKSVAATYASELDSFNNSCENNCSGGSSSWGSPKGHSSGSHDHPHHHDH